MRANEFIKETASAGATTSGNIAVVVNPAVARSKKKAKSVSALDTNYSLFGAGMIKRNPKKPLATL